jgi:MFS family permease
VSAPVDPDSARDVLAEADAGPGGPGPGLPTTEPPTGQPAAGGFSSLRPLRHRNYALLWSGGLVSIIGSWMQTVAVGALIASHTGSALWVVVVAAGGFLPIGVLSPVGGALADRLPRRAVLIAANLVAGAVALVIAVLVAAHEYGPLALTLLVTAQGCVSAITGPFQQAILPDLVPRSEFLAASSLNSAQFNLGRVIGPALAGATVLAFGYPMAFVANAVSFLAVVLALAFVHLAPPPAAPPEGRPSLATSLRSGFVAAREEPGCRAAIIVIAVVALLASPFIALVPAVAHRLSHGGSRGVASATALLTTAQGVGAVLGALLIAPLAGRFGRGRMLFGALFALAPVLILYDFAPELAWAVATLFLVGVVYIGVLSGLSTVVQLRAPTEFRGRILSLYLVALGVSYPIGSLIEGPIADHIGLPWTTASAAAVLLVVLCAIRLARADLFSELSSG